MINMSFVFCFVALQHLDEREFKIHAYVINLTVSKLIPNYRTIVRLVFLSILAVFSKISPRRNHPVWGCNLLTQSEDYKKCQCTIAKFHQNITKTNTFTG